MRRLTQIMRAVCLIGYLISTSVLVQAANPWPCYHEAFPKIIAGPTAGV